MPAYRMSIAATIYFVVDASDEDEAMRKARVVERAFPSPEVIDIDHEYVDSGDAELYVDHNVEGPLIEEVFDEDDAERGSHDES